MLKLMAKEIFTTLAQNFCLSKPMEVKVNLILFLPPPLPPETFVVETNWCHLDFEYGIDCTYMRMTDFWSSVLKLTDCR